MAAELDRIVPAAPDRAYDMRQVIDAIVDTFSEVKEQAGEMSDESWVVTGFSRFFTYVKSIPERLEIEGIELPQSIDLIAFALIMTGSADCSS
jgi:hypothetical protein